MIVLSYVQIDPLLAARVQGLPNCLTSPDLGLSQVTVALSDDGISYPGDERISWSILEEANANPNACYRLTHGKLQPIQAYSAALDRFYSLYPTQSAPTMLISGIPMHRVKDSNPWQDTQSKIKAAGINPGKVLDTATGLGYTAILAAKTASQVITVELDDTVQEIAVHNPWSQDLFANPKITRIIGDGYAVIQDYPDGEFSRIIHDPPVFSLGGELYSLEFYRQAYRVLKRTGRLFHYIGNPESKSGASLTRGVIQRLKSAGFQRVVAHPEAFGVVAFASQ